MENFTMFTKVKFTLTWKFKLLKVKVLSLVSTGRAKKYYDALKTDLENNPHKYFKVKVS